MKYLALYLNAPLMSWSTDSKFENKDTNEFPSKSAIYGMICCALGRSGEQIEFLEKLNNSIKMSVICYSDINYITDYQTIGCKYNPNDNVELLKIPRTANKKNRRQKILNKTYLVNGKYLVILKSEDEQLLNELAVGFKYPVWPIFFGRKCCIPSAKMFKGIYSSEEELFNTVNIKESKKFIVSDEKIPNANKFSLTDVPVKFGEYKEYMIRHVYKYRYVY